MDALQIAKLTEYAELDGTEVGEVLSLLINIHGYEAYLGDHFFRTLETEMEDQLDWFQNNTKIIKHEVTETHTIKELDYYKTEE